jgi:hypothetical protein
MRDFLRRFVAFFKECSPAAYYIGSYVAYLCVLFGAVAALTSVVANVPGHGR